MYIFMYISYSGADSQYASAAESFRHGTKTSVQYTYLGRVVDREKGIYKKTVREVISHMIRKQIPMDLFRMILYLRFSRTEEHGQIESCWILVTYICLTKFCINQV